jgi:hypothetical protein
MGQTEFLVGHSNPWTVVFLPCSVHWCCLQYCLLINWLTTLTVHIFCVHFFSSLESAKKIWIMSVCCGERPDCLQHPHAFFHLKLHPTKICNSCTWHTHITHNIYFINTGTIYLKFCFTSLKYTCSFNTQVVTFISALTESEVQAQASSNFITIF